MICIYIFLITRLPFQADDGLSQAVRREESEGIIQPAGDGDPAGARTYPTSPGGTVTLAGGQPLKASQGGAVTSGVVQSSTASGLAAMGAGLSAQAQGAALPLSPPLVEPSSPTRSSLVSKISCSLLLQSAKSTFNGLCRLGVSRRVPVLLFLNPSLR